MKNPFLVSLCCFSMGILGNLHAVSGEWITSGGAAWDTVGPSNWRTIAGSGVLFPNAIGDKAGFIAIPFMAPGTITSGTSITIQSLYTDPNIQPFSITFTPPRTLTFQGPAGQRAQIFSGRVSVGINTPVILGSPLEVFPGQAGTLSFGSPISGVNIANTFTLNGDVASSVIFSAANSYTGGTIINSGTLNISGAASKTAIPGNLTVNGFPGNLGAITFANTPIVASNQFGPNSVVTVNGGMFNLTGTTQTFPRLMVISGQVGTGAGNLQTSTLNLTGTDGVIQMAGGSISVPTINLPATGAISIQYLPSATQANVGSAAQAVNIFLNKNTVDLTVPAGDNTIADIDFTNTSFINGSLTKSQNGTALFERNGTIPALTINAGTVQIGLDPSIGNFVTATGPLQINPLGILQGVGTLSIDGNAVTNSGIVGPGTELSIGTLTIVGNYAQTATGTLFIQAFKAGTITSPTGAVTNGVDQLTVRNGAVTLDGTLRLEALVGATFNAGDQIVVIDNALGTGITGTFSSYFANIPDNLCSTIQYNPNQVLILFAASTCPFTPAPPAPSLTNFIGFGNLQFASINEHQLQLNRRMLFLRSRLPTYTESYATKSSRGEQILLASSDPLIAFAAVADQGYDDQIDVSRFRNNPQCQPFSIYIAPLGSMGDVDRISSQNGFTFHSVGGLVGADYAFTKIGIGAQIGYEHFDAHVDHNWGNFKIDTLFANAYATIAPFSCIPLFLDLTASGGGNWYDIHRKIAGEVAQGTPHGWEWDAYAGLGYDFYFRCNRWRVTPLASIQYIHLHINDFKEHGAGDQNVDVEHESFNSLRSWLGASFGSKIERCNLTLLPEVRGYWLHEFAGTHHHVEVVSAPFGSTAQVQVLGGKRNYGVVGGELRALFADNWSLEASYDYYWNPQISTHFLYGELSYGW